MSRALTMSWNAEPPSSMRKLKCFQHLSSSASAGSAHSQEVKHNEIIWSNLTSVMILPTLPVLPSVFLVCAGNERAVRSGSRENSHLFRWLTISVLSSADKQMVCLGLGLILLLLRVWPLFVSLWLNLIKYLFLLNFIIGEISLFLSEVGASMWENGGFYILKLIEIDLFLGLLWVFPVGDD